jgi:hypothetical protein
VLTASIGQGLDPDTALGRGVLHLGTLLGGEHGVQQSTHRVSTVLLIRKGVVQGNGALLTVAGSANLCTARSVGGVEGGDGEHGMSPNSLGIMGCCCSKNYLTIHGGVWEGGVHMVD